MNRLASIPSTRDECVAPPIVGAGTTSEHETASERGLNHWDNPQLPRTRAATGGRPSKTPRRREGIPEPSVEVYERFRVRDESALPPVFNYLCERLVLFARVYLGNLDDAEEAVQRAFVKVWNAPQPIRDAIPVRVALYQATQNEALNLREQERRRSRLLDAHMARALVVHPSTPEDHAHAALLLRDVVAAVERLPERVRQPFWLHWYEGQGYDDISRALGIGTRTAQKYVLRAYKDLRAHMESRVSTS